MRIETAFKEIIDENAHLLGDFAEDRKEALVEYMAERASAIAALIEAGEPGIGEAMEVARNRVALKMGIEAVDAARWEHQVMLGIVTGAIRTAAFALI